MSKKVAEPTLYPDTIVPNGLMWRNSDAVKEFNSIKKFLRVARTTQNLDTLAARMKIRQHKLMTKKNYYDASVLIAFGLGMTMMLGIGFVVFSSSLVDLGLFLILLSFFHLWEYIYVSLFHPETLSYECTEKLNMKVQKKPTKLPSNAWIYVPAFIIAAAGQAIRTKAMHFAGVSFHHMVQDEKAENHTLVKHGIYSIWRHPSYFGWFWWSVFTQVLLASPVSIVAFTVASWMFFADRIPYEEERLGEMYGREYEEYCKKTGIWIPFMKSAY